MGGSRHSWIFFSFSFCAQFGISKTVAFAVGFDDMDTMGEPIEQCPGEPLVAEDLGPLLEGEIGRHEHALPFVGATEHFKKQFGPRFGKRYVSQFIQDNQILTFELLVQALECLFLPAFQ